ncbi:hypothetical protein AC249_AIPGENE7173 [Exaiptasia diaphana]|nr:hypothetical protein AC249_AIPGENE7173 [Exaiptasia diaphana]
MIAKTVEFALLPTKGRRFPANAGAFKNIAANIKEVFHFPRKSSNDYVIMKEPFVSLRAFTLALWVQVDNSTKEHAPFAFTTPTSEEEIEIWLSGKDYTAFYIKDKPG